MKANPLRDPQSLGLADNENAADSLDTIPDFMLTFPKEFHDEYLNINDPCLSSPCLFGKLCRAVNLKDYICVDEKNEKNPLVGDRHHIFSHVNDLFGKMAAQKIIEAQANNNNNQNNGFTQLRGKKVDPCASNPCPGELECVPKKGEFECVEKKSDADVNVASGGEQKQKEQQAGRFWTF